MSKSASDRIRLGLTGSLLACGVLFSGAAEAKHGKMMQVELINMQRATMENGAKATVYVVKMDGHMMVAIPANHISDSLRRQLFRTPCKQNFGTGYCS
ncbi:hypothetical protein Msil_0856 [Methylocella silvestris BL2]|uniref:Uncharacterized protein n=1 Tax=Methylocella silvestris (strain DSM 15510 / CIP 108128 / LMG 27833 / NCIMB 13906 / BL2) TaxID=395965 RepID=B8ESD6_METSB|nr:hypothetical protein [Methylocella silvestris]ACK49826.1 hypothetical protein Msil_0856 [Methylocella silvestris BL2]